MRLRNSSISCSAFTRLNISKNLSISCSTLSIFFSSCEIYKSKNLSKVTDVIGREIDVNSAKSVLLYIYDDGSMDKKIIIE